MTKKNNKNVCVYCNGAPTNHAFHFFETSMELFFADTFCWMYFDWPVWAYDGAKQILIFFNFILNKVGVLSYDTDLEKVPDERTKSVLAEAKKRGIPYGNMTLFGKHLIICRVYVKPKGYKKARWFYFESLPTPPHRKQEDHTWIDDKLKFKKRFLKEELPVVRSFVVTKKEQALQVFEELGTAVIVKPRSGSRARHTTVNISNKEDLLKAFALAKQLCHYVLIEEYITGPLYRATVIGGRLIGVVKFIKPAVVADGVMNIRELLDYHNAHKKYPNITDVKLDEWVYDAVSHQGYTMDSVPERGKEILLTEHSERPNGGYFIDVTDDVPEENVKIIERATEILKLDVVGFDIISLDLTKPFSKQKFYFIEANTLPFIELHLVLYEGKVRDTPKALWDLWF